MGSGGRRRRRRHGRFGQPDDVLGGSALVLSENGELGEEEGRVQLKQRPFDPVGATNRDQRVFRPGWWHQPGP